ncbi:DNA mismatch repair endonuclease MutL [Murimonas intestini]|uniref:DNA mismatch repair endonuclease MutL n=1 Tax=Murimonas intestini TaxID=1337051 RepID=UPI00214B1B83|nr:DNA mismatch repair endonuclease MutL [Murimonas intestini]MCR1839070.1 DNA mismatch repair endonuclease MutL [Murimonas intestini]MCR1864366.1 DNA mismatch repair endonuclease MutL [Murimonas intestini]MCR1881976.1 DNA mismatch repair endonuclease MutL [Murimonas intestini]
MNNIAVLDKSTVDKIAAGEVIERPASVVKELVENAIDAGANAVTVEIKEGGISFIRITDNGEGIPADQVPLAFLRHATSKIKKVEDLLSVASLGFRGEALSSIAAVCQVELITKTAGSITGCRYIIEGGQEKSQEEIGAPEGTTFLVRNLFFNTPARKKFLKSPMTEAGYISDIMERMALSHPEVSFKFINNNQTRLHTSGNTNLKDIIYGIYGRDIAGNLIEIKDFGSGGPVELKGFIGKPVISRGNRNYENYFINGRYIKSKIISKAIEDAYKTFMMQHKYPFTALHFTIDGSYLDVNVHPTKMELRFANNEEMYRFVYEAVKAGLTHRELIPQVTVGKEEAVKKPEPPVKEQIPEPFEKNRLQMIREQSGYGSYGVQSRHMADPPRGKAPAYQRDQGCGRGPSADKATASRKELDGRNAPSHDAGSQDMASRNADDLYTASQDTSSRNAGSLETVSRNAASQYTASQNAGGQETISRNALSQDIPSQNAAGQDTASPNAAAGLPEAAAPLLEQEALPKQMELFEDKLLDAENVKRHKIIGQIFDTYWLVEFDDKLFIIDQHAAHEKVLYERTMKSLKNKEFTSQQISPPVILTLSMQEEELLLKYMENFTQIGYEIEPFGGNEYSIRAVPGNMFGVAQQDLFIEMLDGLSSQTGRADAEIINEKIASMSCKAAVKGNHKMSFIEVEALIDELLKLDNPYNCPHGRPTIISMTKYEMEKKFKRIV